MARYIYQGWTFDGMGKVIGGATVSVYLAGTTTVVDVYAAVSGGTAVNSVTSDTTDGSFLFYVDDGDYTTADRFKIVVSKTGFTSKTLDYLIILHDYV